MQPGQPPPGEEPTQHNPHASPPPPPEGYGPPPGTPQYGQPASPPGYGPPAGYGATPGYDTPPGYGTPPAQPQNTLGLLAMIFGIAGIPLAVCCALLGVGAGGAGVVLGVLGMRKVSEGLATNRGMALAGVICGAVAAVVGIGNMILGASMALTDSPF